MKNVKELSKEFVETFTRRAAEGTRAGSGDDQGFVDDIYNYVNKQKAFWIEYTEFVIKELRGMDKMIYQINGYSIEAESVVDYKDFKKYNKKLNTKAVKMHAPFKVHSKEGPVEGKAGDFLMMGIEGEMYVCDSKIFKKSYEEVQDDSETGSEVQSDEGSQDS